MRVDKVKVEIEVGRCLAEKAAKWVWFTILQFPFPSRGEKRTHTRAKLSAAISPTHGTAEYTHTERKRRSR